MLLHGLYRAKISTISQYFIELGRDKFGADVPGSTNQLIRPKATLTISLIEYIALIFLVVFEVSFVDYKIKYLKDSKQPTNYTDARPLL